MLLRRPQRRKTTLFLTLLTEELRENIQQNRANAQLGLSLSLPMISIPSERQMTKMPPSGEALY